jgi:hypothetical protein
MSWAREKGARKVQKKCRAILECFLITNRFLSLIDHFSPQIDPIIIKLESTNKNGKMARPKLFI